MEFPVLVAEAHTLGSIATIRSLGSAGYPVHAVSHRSDGLGLYSRFAQAGVVCPGYDDPSFLDWLRCYIKKNQIGAIIPSEGLLLAVRSSFSEFASLLPYSSSESVVYAAMSKADQIGACIHGPRAAASRNHIPAFLLLNSSKQTFQDGELEALELPLYIKVDGCHARERGESAVYPASSLSQARALVERLAASYAKVLVQAHVEGCGAGVFFLRWKGQPLAEFMHLRLHEVPHTGGVSSYRKSWWHQAMRDDAWAKLEAMDWEGVAMLEYRWKPATDQFYFLEMNGRFWGSLHLALFAGVDFPRILVDALQGRLSLPVMGPRQDIRCRYTFPRDVMYVWSILKDVKINVWAKLNAVLEFFALSLNPEVRSDLWFPGDRLLYGRQLGRFIKEIFRA